MGMMKLIVSNGIRRSGNHPTFSVFAWPATGTDHFLILSSPDLPVFPLLSGLGQSGKVREAFPNRWSGLVCFGFFISLSDSRVGAMLLFNGKKHSVLPSFL